MPHVMTCQIITRFPVVECVSHEAYAFVTSTLHLEDMRNCVRRPRVVSVQTECLLAHALSFGKFVALLETESVHAFNMTVHGHVGCPPALFVQHLIVRISKALLNNTRNTVADVR